MAGHAALALVLVLVVALGLRLGIAIVLWDRAPADDERFYHECALGVIEGRGIASFTPAFASPGGGRPTSLWGCLQPLWIAASYALFGVLPGPVYLLNTVLGLVTVAAAFLLGRRLGGVPGAVAAGLLVALDVYLVKFTATLLSETLYTALLALALVVLASASERGGAARALASGALLGLAALTRATAFYFAPLTLVWLVAERRRRVLPGRLLREAACFTGALALTLAPWVIRNRIVHDRPVFLDTKAGYNLYSFLHPEFDPWRGNEPALPAAALDPAASESRRNEILVDLARENLRRDPWSVIARAPAKVWLMLSPFPGRLTHPDAGWLKTAFVLPLEILALAGIVRERFRSPTSRLLGGLLAYYVLLHCVMTGGPRFRVPLDPALAAFAGAALGAWPRRARNGGASRISPGSVAPTK